ncbi:MAG: hypothetical protein ACOCSL_00630 [Thermoplasmatota archaeon]
MPREKVEIKKTDCRRLKRLKIQRKGKNPNYVVCKECEGTEEYYKIDCDGEGKEIDKKVIEMPYNRSVKVGLKVLEYMAGVDGPKLRGGIVKELEDQIDELPSKSTINRILNELKDQGYLERKGRKWAYSNKEI